MKYFRHVSAFVLVAMLSLGIGAVDASAQSLRMGAGQQGSASYTINTAMALALSAETGMQISVQSFGGPFSFMPLMQSGDLDLSVIVTPDLGDAIRGTGPFEGFPMDNLQVLASLFPLPVGLLVDASSDIHSISDLAGKRVAWGLPSQPSLLPYVEGALANGGLTVDDVTLVPVTSVVNAVDELVVDLVDATLFAVHSAKVVEADSMLGGVRWLPFDTSDEAVAAMQSIAPDAHLVEVTPDSGAVGVPEPMYTMAYDWVLAVGEHVPDDTVRRIAEILRDQGRELSEARSGLEPIDPESLYRPYRGLPYHPAAEAVIAGN